MPTQKHQAAVERAEVFAGDFMAYLDLPAVWDELNLDDSQKRVLFTLTDEAKAGNLNNHGVKGSYDGFPYFKLVLATMER